MIQSFIVRAIGSALATCIVLSIRATPAAAGEPTTAVIYWEPPGSSRIGDSVRAAFADATRSMDARFVDARVPVAALPSLILPLVAAKDAYARFAFADAIVALDELQRAAETTGGGDLDRRQLSEIFLYRGLAKLETTTAETAWEDLVRAARLDPTRVIDPAHFPPRAVGVYKRAAAEIATLPLAELTLEVPAGSAVRVDGAPWSEPASVLLGPHLVSVVAEGYEPWAAVVSVSSKRTRLVPPLHAYQPPEGDRLLALAGASSTHRLLLGALERREAGWRFTVRDITLPEGKFLSDSVAIGDVPARAAVGSLVRRLVSPPPPPPRSRWVVWTIAGGTALVIAASAALALGHDTSSPNVAGNLGSWR